MLACSMYHVLFTHDMGEGATINKVWKADQGLRILHLRHHLTPSSQTGDLSLSGLVDSMGYSPVAPTVYFSN